MALSLKNEETHRMIKELADLTGESQAEAVRKAVAGRLIIARKAKARTSERLLQIAREAAPLFPVEFDSSKIDEMLYNERGLPL